MNKQPKTVKLTPDEIKKLNKYRDKFMTDIACYKELCIDIKIFRQLKTIGTCGQSTYAKLYVKIFSK